MKINYIRAKNFLSIGSCPVEVDFTKYGNIIQIKGENRDHGLNSSNGSGKSSILYIIVYALFGELIKNLNHQEIIHVKAKRDLEAEVRFELGGNSYRVVRRRKPDELELWKNDIDESKGGIIATQVEINKIIKLNYNAFVNVMFFGQHNTKQFLVCKPSDKRDIAESLLSLDKYVVYCDAAKKRLKIIQEKIDVLSVVYEKTLQDVYASERQVKQILKQRDEWRSSQLNAIERLCGQRTKAMAELDKVTTSACSVDCDSVQLLEEELSAKVASKNRLIENIVLARKKMETIKEERQNVLLATKEVTYAITKLQRDVKGFYEENRKLIEQDGGTCPTCYGKINRHNYQSVIDYNNQQAVEAESQVHVLKDGLKGHQTRHRQLNDFLNKLSGVCEEVEAKELLLSKSIRELEQKKVIASVTFREKINSAILLLEQQLVNYNEQIEQKQMELGKGDPYNLILDELKSELEKAGGKVIEKKAEIDELSELVPYHEFWVKAFGDDGIRSFILAEVIPILNARINYWLQFLVDNKIKINFNTELETAIERNPPDGDLFVYNAMSGGEHQRIDLGIALAFAQVMMLTSGTCPSIVALDEVGTNLDRPGIQAIYNTICELSRERQVLVTTHDPDLQEMLSGHDVINVVKSDGVTTLGRSA